MGRGAGRPRRFKSERELEKAFEAYKANCDNRKVTVNEFSARNSEFVTGELRRCVTYTIEGFCRFAHLTRAQFYDTYDKDPSFADTVTRMREECEVDAREKFETGQIPTQLAGLWMSNYGYGAKPDAPKEDAGPHVLIYGSDALED